MNWRIAYENTTDFYRKSDILRAVLAVSKSPDEISDIYQKTLLLPIGLQHHIIWDIMGNSASPVPLVAEGQEGAKP